MQKMHELKMCTGTQCKLLWINVSAECIGANASSHTYRIKLLHELYPNSVLYNSFPDSNIVWAQIQPTSGPCVIHIYQMWARSEPHHVAVRVKFTQCSCFYFGELPVTKHQSVLTLFCLTFV